MPVGFNHHHGEKPLRLVAVALAISGVISSLIIAQALASPPLSSKSQGPDKNDADAFQVTFLNVTERAGLNEPFIYGGIEKKKYIIETNGCGVAFIDYDNDGWMDILLLNGTRLEGFPKGKEPTIKLYHNNQDGTFTDATNGSGLSRSGWASAVTVGDYDNDGYDDLFVTYWGQNALYHNDGKGKFTEVTAKAGVATSGTRWG